MFLTFLINTFFNNLSTLNLGSEMESFFNEMESEKCRKNVQSVRSRKQKTPKKIARITSDNEDEIIINNKEDDVQSIVDDGMYNNKGGKT